MANEIDFELDVGSALDSINSNIMDSLSDDVCEYTDITEDVE